MQKLIDTLKSFFTFHNVSINTAIAHNVINRLFDFTFHNVSINTKWQKQLTQTLMTLHSTMFLLIPTVSVMDSIP